MSLCASPQEAVFLKSHTGAWFLRGIVGSGQRQSWPGVVALCARARLPGSGVGFLDSVQDQTDSRWSLAQGMGFSLQRLTVPMAKGQHLKSQVQLRSRTAKGAASPRRKQHLALAVSGWAGMQEWTQPPSSNLHPLSTPTDASP